MRFGPSMLAPRDHQRISSEDHDDVVVLAGATEASPCLSYIEDVRSTSMMDEEEDGEEARLAAPLARPRSPSLAPPAPDDVRAGAQRNVAAASSSAPPLRSVSERAVPTSSSVMWAQRVPLPAGVAASGGDADLEAGPSNGVVVSGDETIAVADGDDAHQEAAVAPPPSLVTYDMIADLFRAMVKHVGTYALTFTLLSLAFTNMRLAGKIDLSWFWILLPLDMTILAIWGSLRYHVELEDGSISPQEREQVYKWHVLIVFLGVQCVVLPFLWEGYVLLPLTAMMVPTWLGMCYYAVASRRQGTTVMTIAGVVTYWAVALLLITLRVDLNASTPWTLTILPVWLACAALILTLIQSSGFLVLYRFRACRPSSLSSWLYVTQPLITAVGISLCFLGPLIAFVAMITLKLDRFPHLPWDTVFVPVYVLLTTMTMLACVVMYFDEEADLMGHEDPNIWANAFPSAWELVQEQFDFPAQYRARKAPEAA